MMSASCSNLILLLLLFLSLVCHSSGKKIVDLTRPFNSNSISFAGSTPFHLQEVKRGKTEQGFWYESYNFNWGDHSGTYLDAPARFAEGKWMVPQIPLRHLIAPGVVITKAAKTADVSLSVEDLETWEQKNEKIQNGTIVLVNFDWGKYHETNRNKYLGSAALRPEYTELKFPGISPDAAKWLVNRSVYGVGVDTPMVDRAPSEYFQTQHILNKANIYTLGNLDKINNLKTKGFTVYALPLRITGGSSSPVRVMVAE